MTAHRHKTYFGVSIPPFVDDYFPEHYELVPLRFVITGKVPSKKNLQNARIARADAVRYVNQMFKDNGSMSKREVIDALDKCYAYFKPNDQYNDFVKEWKPKLLEQAAYWSGRFKEGGLVFPIEKCSCSIKIYKKYDYRQDNGNKSETIHDLLVDCGIISDDCDFVLNPTYQKTTHAYVGKIAQNIMVVDLTIFNEIKPIKRVELI